MEIESIAHKALRRFVETGEAQGLIEADRLRKMIAFMVAAETLDEVATPPNYGFHALAGDRAGTYSMVVTRNWRMTFGVNADDALIDLDLEDYH